MYAKLVGDFYDNSRQNLYKLIQVEAVMRVIKSHLRRKLRQEASNASGEDSESLLLVTAANVLNGIFCLADDPESWKRKNDWACSSLVDWFNFTANHAVRVVDAFLRVRPITF